MIRSVLRTLDFTLRPEVCSAQVKTTSRDGTCGNYKERVSVWFCSGSLSSRVSRPQSFIVFPDHLTVSNGRALEGRRPRAGGRVSCGRNAPVFSPFRPRVSCTLCWLYWLRYTRNCRHVVVWSRQHVYICVCVSFLWSPHTAPSY